jgi:hypothetical protein
MKPHPLLRSGVAALAFLFLLASACSENVSSGKDWQVANNPDNFQFQVTGFENYSKHLEYVWTNTGTAASVNQACSITGGSATLTVKDAAGATVYSRSLKDNGTYPTLTGTSGSWLIQINLDKTDGTLNFRVQKSP